MAVCGRFEEYRFSTSRGASRKSHLTPVHYASRSTSRSVKPTPSEWTEGFAIIVPEAADHLAVCDVRHVKAAGPPSLRMFSKNSARRPDAGH